MINGLKVGRVVDYVFRDADPKKRIPAQVRAAIISGIRDEESGTVNLTVILDWPADRNTPEGQRSQSYVCAEDFVPFSSKGERKRTWKFQSKA